nr:type I methionyl aminopeptidase [Acidobacteriota bacterium]
MLPLANESCWCGSGRKYKRCHKPLEGRVLKGVVSPMRSVPDHIEKPPYALTGQVRRRSESAVKSPDVIARMRRAGAVAAEVLRLAGAKVKPGITTEEIDVYVHELCIARGAYPSPLNYQNFPKSVCTSVNEVICHGIPDSRELLDGDIVNLDVTCFLDGVHGDTNATFAVGNISDEDQRLIQVTEECMWLGIETVKPNVPLCEIGRAIETHAKKLRYGVVKAFIGHGIGEQFHTDVQILHYYEPRNNMLMQPGMTFTIEPMITIGSDKHRMWDDEWTAVTIDGKRTAQFEHTVLVTDEGFEVLTAPNAVSPKSPFSN